MKNKHIEVVKDVFLTEEEHQGNVEFDELRDNQQQDEISLR